MTQAALIPAPTASAPFAFELGALLTSPSGWGAALASWMLSAGLTTALVAGGTYLAVRAYLNGVDHVFAMINQKLKPDAMARVSQRSNTLSGILKSLGKAVLIFLAAMIIFPKLGVNVAPILASAGIVGLAVGFGAQSLVKDVINGFFILMEDQYGVGDMIEVDGKTGLVERMNLRITQVRAQSGELITLPNGTIQKVVNHSKDWARAVLDIGVGYHEDPDRVTAVLQAVADELCAEMPEKMAAPVEILGLDSFRDSDMVFKLIFKTQPLEQWAVARAFRRKLWYRFREEGIGIPFPQRHLWIASPPQEAASVVAKPSASGA